MFVFVWIFIVVRVCQNVDETILYLNARNSEMESLAEPFTKPPYNVKLLGNSVNYGIATALNWLFGNSTNEYVLFLEKDFRLVENLNCVMSQMAEGVRMLQVCACVPLPLPVCVCM